MSRLGKLARVAVTLEPRLYMAAFAATVVLALLHPERLAPGGPGVPAWFLKLFAAHVASMLVMFGLAVFYAVHAYRSPRLPEQRRILWVVLVIVGAFVGQLVYWFLFVWPEPEPSTASS